MEDFPKAERHWFAVDPEQARRCWAWSFWCAARNRTTNLVYASPLRKPCKNSRPTWPPSVTTLQQLVRARKLAIDYVEIERKQIEETGEYNLDGLFVRLKQAI